MDRLFSIVTPAYNVAPYLPAMVESVIRQTCEDWELIVVDDGSNDGGGDLLDSYAAKDSRIRVAHTKNGGVSSARNLALRMVTGKYVVFLDADDLLHEDGLERIRHAFALYPNADLVKYSYSAFSDDKGVVWSAHETRAEFVDVHEKLPVGFVMAPFWTFSIRRDVLHGIVFGPYCTGEDRLFIGTVLSRARAVVVLNSNLYGYRIRCGSAMNSPTSKRKLLDRIGYSLEWLDVLTKSIKNIDSTFYHLVTVNLTEGFIYCLHRLPIDEQKELWRAWYQCLDALKEFRCQLTPWGRFVVGFCSLFHFRFVPFILCYVPHRMKALGLTRAKLLKK